MDLAKRKDIPNKTLNQHLQKAINAIVFASNNNTHNIGDTANKFENIINSEKNFTVPGIPEYKIHIKKIQTPKFGVV